MTCVSQLEKAYFEVGTAPANLNLEGALSAERSDISVYESSLLALPECQQLCSLRAADF